MYEFGAGTNRPSSHGSGAAARTIRHHNKTRSIERDQSASPLRVEEQYVGLVVGRRAGVIYDRSRQCRNCIDASICRDRYSGRSSPSFSGGNRLSEHATLVGSLS